MIIFLLLKIDEKGFKGSRIQGPQGGVKGLEVKTLESSASIFVLSLHDRLNQAQRIMKIGFRRTPLPLAGTERRTVFPII